MKFATDLKNPLWIHFKGILLAAIGIIAGLLLVMQTPYLENTLSLRGGHLGVLPLLLLPISCAGTLPLR
jgi:hypothetical protein